MKKLLGLVMAGAFACSAGPIFVATLSGDQEVPMRETDASGTGSAVLTDSMLSVQIDFEGLTGPAVAAHIHCCPGPAGNGPVAVGFEDFPMLSSGSYSKTFDLDLAATYGGGFLGGFGGDVAMAKAAFVGGLKGGLAYFNIHTAMYPGGEIRGNIVATPEPASLVLMGCGIAVLGLARRRYRTNS